MVIFLLLFNLPTPFSQSELGKRGRLALGSSDFIGGAA
jgi:hypothetical protein